MTHNSTGKLIAGIVLLTSFAGVMFLIFMPLFDGANALNYMDNLYNSISKGSAYYIPKMTHLVEEHPDRAVKLNLKLGDADLTEDARVILEASGTTATVQGDILQVTGEIKSVLDACLRDSEIAYHNRGDELASKYGMPPRSAIHAWWSVLGAAERELNRQKLFPEAHLVHAVQTKAVECAYNYYGIEPGRIGERWGIVLFSLVFYVVYTVWYGYGIMFLFEGLGFRLAH